MAMGTLVTVTVVFDRGRRAQAEAAIGNVERMLLNFGRDGWAWGSGALARLNQSLAAGLRGEVPSSLRPLLQRACEIRVASGGLYDARIGALVRLWGFDEASRVVSAPPADDEIAALLTALREAPAYDGGRHYGPAPGVVWDLGGIGKGYIVDAALERLAILGFADASVDAGGNLAVRGTRGDRAWRVGIRDVRADGDGEDAGEGSVLGSFDACDESVITHGTDQRYFMHGGYRYSHLLDPRSGRPAQGLRALTVVHRDATLADAAGAALFVAGRAHWPALAQRFGIEQVLSIDDQGHVAATPALARRLRMQTGVAIRRVA